MNVRKLLLYSTLSSFGCLKAQFYNTLTMQLGDYNNPHCVKIKKTIYI